MSAEPATMIDNLIYTGGALDRVSELRRDAGWIAGRLADPATRVLPLWRDRNLVHGGDEPRPVFLTGAEARAALEGAASWALLGLADGIAHVAADLADAEEPPAPAGTAFIDLRQVGPAMAPDAASLLAYARGVLHWRRHNGFCAACGHPAAPTQGGHVLKCGNPACGREHFPRTDPAVIMAVTRDGPDGGAILLARQNRWMAGMYSVLAGFVEPGESLEEAVIREVGEEAAITVAEVRYRASQPWPFPASLMVGFRARAVDFDIRFDTGELDDARWFTKAEVRAFTDNPRLPRIDSIARRLIEEWLAE